MNYQPAIIVIGYNRPRSLTRLLASLASANYLRSDICLIISVDYSDTSEGRLVRELANNFQWNHGEKRLILHEQNLGLRTHVLSCGDLSTEYGSVIVLEDDLTVGPEFYRYAVVALDFADDHDEIGGVSLYDHRTNFINRLPFTPIHDGCDNYYLQIAASWGQAWTAPQWNAFRNWYNELPMGGDQLPVMASSPLVPREIYNWPDTSWVKFFINYLAEENRYFLYPRISHTTNNSDSGTHVGKTSSKWQVPLSLRIGNLRFSTPGEALAVYDSSFEIRPANLKLAIPSLADFEFTTDLYGSKTAETFQSELVLTSKQSEESALQCFPLETKPMEHNMLAPCSPSVAYFKLAQVDQTFGASTINLSDRRVLEYFYGPLALKKVAKSLPGYFFQK